MERGLFELGAYQVVKNLSGRARRKGIGQDARASYNTMGNAIAVFFCP